MKKKKHFRIGEVSQLLDIPAYVLRYWESEFPQLKPIKTNTGQRLFTQDDIDLVKIIIHLRYNEKLTLPGTKTKLKEILNPKSGVEMNKQMMDSLAEIKNCLQEILSDLR